MVPPSIVGVAAEAKSAHGLVCVHAVPVPEKETQDLALVCACADEPGNMEPSSATTNKAKSEAIFMTIS